MRNTCVIALEFDIVGVTFNPSDDSRLAPAHQVPAKGEAFMALNLGSYTSIIRIPNDGSGGGPQWTIQVGKLSVVPLNTEVNRNLLAK